MPHAFGVIDTVHAVNDSPTSFVIKFTGYHLTYWKSPISVLRAVELLKLPKNVYFEGPQKGIKNIF
jgi:hypothetical protein